MKHILSSILLFTVFFFVSCTGEKSSTGNSDQAHLIPSDTLCFAIDDTTYYESKAMFQFEDKGREYLWFQNRRDKGKPHILIYDIEEQNVYKSIPLYKEGPDGIPSIFGGYPLDMDHSLITTDSQNFYIVDGEGHILYKSPSLYQYGSKGEAIFSEYCTTRLLSYYAKVGIFRDSTFYFPQSQIGYPHTKETWSTSNLFACLDFRTGKLGRTQFGYPAIFDKEEIRRKFSYENGHSYADTGKDIAVSFAASDSIYVSADFHHVRAYNAKSRYFPHLCPQPYNAQQDLIVRLRAESQNPSYHHLLYDKYRKVFYRFARFPYEYPNDRSPMGEDTGRQFSIIILNENYEIIGETRFPGNTYAYRLWFIGKNGLYLSLNNQGNPGFDEDRLLFQRMKLEYKNKLL